MKRNTTPKQRIKECVNKLVKEIDIWRHIQEQGCNDPFLDRRL